MDAVVEYSLNMFLFARGEQERWKRGASVGVAGASVRRVAQAIVQGAGGGGAPVVLVLQVQEQPGGLALGSQLRAHTHTHTGGLTAVEVSCAPRHTHDGHPPG